ncbi:MAG: hypothetical protein NC397_01590 [Clostridium sp.]|nr:hypothetical protein [Clostridium sp.]
MKKRVISLVLASAIILSSIALSFYAYASSRQLTLNVKSTAVINGANDLEWFYYTPDESGLYSLLSYNTPKSQAYLFVMEEDKDTHIRQMVNLAYSNSDPNWEKNGHGNLQFCLTYHLDAGVTYYYAVGWYMAESRVDGSTTVMLRCDAYDSNAIESIDFSCPAELDVYMNGAWENDAKGNEYFKYNLSRLTSNSVVTVHYSNGTSSTVYGKNEVDGYRISYIDNQYEKHWYPENDPNYNGNIFTVKILDKTASCSIKVSSSSRYLVKGVIHNTIGEPVDNATISNNGQKLAVTDINGQFSFYMISGAHTFNISTASSIDRDVLMTISASADNNDFTDSPFVLCNCDYVKDGYVNAKDFAYILKNKIDAQDEYKASINFNRDSYNNL